MDISPIHQFMKFHCFVIVELDSDLVETLKAGGIIKRQTPSALQATMTDSSSVGKSYRQTITVKALSS